MKYVSYIFHGSVKVIKNNKMRFEHKVNFCIKGETSSKSRLAKVGPIRTCDILDKFTRAIQNKENTSQLAVNRRY